MSAGASLGPIRPTTRKVDGSNVTNRYTALAHVIRETGLLRRTPVFYLVVFAILVACLGGAITGFVLLRDSWFQLLIAAALGIIFTQFAFLAHEASHRQVFASGRANDRAGRLIGTALVGMSYQWWMTKHSRHHANPNQLGKDPDIAADTFSFTPQDAMKSKGLHAAFLRRQAWLFYPMLTLEGLNLHYQSLRSLLRRGTVSGRAVELTTITLRLAIYTSLVFLFLPLGMAFAFLGVQLAVFGVYMGASFAPNHMGMDIIPEGSRLDFLSKQVLTSRNINGGWWMTVFMGGLNHQIEHHLFPNMARPHLRRTREVVREYCAKIGVPYTERGYGRAHVEVLRSLRVAGLAAPDPFFCPMVAGYRRN